MMDDYKELIKELFLESEKTWEYDRDAWASNKYEEAVDAIEQLVRERDAAIHDLNMAVCGQESYPCQYCANYGIAPIDVDDVCKTCTDCENWEWRGVQNADS